MNYSLHIPRPSLSGSTTSTRSGSSTHSDSNMYLPVGMHTSSSRNLLLNNHEQNINNKIKSNKNITDIDHYKNERKNSVLLSSLDLECHVGRSSNNRMNDTIYADRINNKKIKEKYNNNNNNKNKFNRSMDDRFNYNTNNKINYECDIIGQLKRGSRSSQGSTDSNNSAGTASSGSLLLTTANLERFAAIHNKNPINNRNGILTIPSSSSRTAKTSTTATDQLPAITVNNDTSLQNIYTIANNHINKINGIENGGCINDDNTVLEIDPNLHFIKTKDVDAISIASSTHFTMVNGVGGPQRKNKSSGICSRGHQLTVLILTMSGFFLIGILLMVYLMEMRARDMPQM